MNRTIPSALRSILSPSFGPGRLIATWGLVACSSVPATQARGYRAVASASSTGTEAPGAPSTANGASHPVGAVALGESHAAGREESVPFASASFSPDSSPPACTTDVAGCSVPKIAVCDGVSGPVCTTGQVCVLDDACQPACEAPCAAACDADEECVVDGTGVTCQPTPSFHAGALTFEGTVSPLSLAPPYALDDTEQAATTAPFAPGAVLGVQAVGSSSFAPFDLTFTATTRVHTSLAMLPAARVWGDGAIPVEWEAGDDAIVVTVTGPGGMAQCPASDLSGELEIPRAVVKAVSGSGAHALTLAVTRAREETRTLVPSGSEIVLSTSSTESREFEK